MTKLDAINKLLELSFKLGYEIGYAHFDSSKLIDINGHLKNEYPYEKEMIDSAKLLSDMLDIREEDVTVYIIEDTGYRSEDWEYIPPIIGNCNFRNF